MLLVLCTLNDFSTKIPRIFSSEAIEIALNFVYESGTMSPILRNEEIITQVFRWLLKLEFYSTLCYVVKSIDSSVNDSIYFRMYGDLLLIPNFGRSSWDNSNITEMQNTLELKIIGNLPINYEIVNEGIKEFGFAQMVALIERVLYHNLDLSDIVRIICEWAKDNKERTLSLGELLMICDQAKNIPRVPNVVSVPPPPPPPPLPLTLRPVSRPVTTRIGAAVSFPSRNPPSSLRLFDDDDDESDFDDDDW